MYCRPVSPFPEYIRTFAEFVPGLGGQNVAALVDGLLQLVLVDRAALAAVSSNSSPPHPCSTGCS